MRADPVSLERRLANEQRFHAEAFATLAASFDRIAADLNTERKAHAEAKRREFRLKSRVWFAKGAARV